MKLSEVKSLDLVIEEHREDIEFRVDWDRYAFARDVANRVIQYRTERSLSQRQLAAIVGLAQPQIARLEKAEHQPSFRDHCQADSGYRSGVQVRGCSRWCRVALGLTGSGWQQGHAALGVHTSDRERGVETPPGVAAPQRPADHRAGVSALAIAALGQPVKDSGSKRPHATKSARAR